MSKPRPHIDTHHWWSRSTNPPHCINCGVVQSRAMDLADKGKMKKAWSYDGKNWLFERPNCTRTS